MSLVPPALSVPAAQLASRIARMLEEQDRATAGPVVHELQAGGRPPVTPAGLAAYAGRVAQGLDRPLFRLTPADLAAPEARRVAALLALVDASTVARAVLLVDAASTLVTDPAVAAAVRLRFEDWAGGVVLLAVEESDTSLVERVDGQVQVRPGG